jgi:hypothetical protein
MIKKDKNIYMKLCVNIFCFKSLLYFTLSSWWDANEFYCVDFVYLTSFQLTGIYTARLSCCCYYILAYHPGGIRMNITVLRDSFYLLNLD